MLRAEQATRLRAGGVNRGSRRAASVPVQVLADLLHKLVAIDGQDVHGDGRGPAVTEPQQRSAWLTVIVAAFGTVANAAKPRPPKIRVPLRMSDLFAASRHNARLCRMRSLSVCPLLKPAARHPSSQSRHAPFSGTMRAAKIGTHCDGVLAIAIKSF